MPPLRAFAFPLLVFPLVVVVLVGCQPGAATKPAPAPTNAKQASADHDHADHDHGATPDAGKGAATESEEHHHPETLAGLVEEVGKLAETVRQAVAEGVREKADGPIHEIGHLLGDVEHLAKEAKLAPEAEAAVTKAGSDLFDAFDKLDQAIHGGDDVAKAWEGQSGAIAAGLKALQDAVAK